MFSEKTSVNQKSAKSCATIWTIIYLILFPIFSWMALFWSAASDPSSIMEYFTIFTWFWTPIAIPLSIYFMWSKYHVRNYKNVYAYCALPFLAFGAFVLINAIIRI